MATIVKQLQLGHSPDPDDAFMFCALAKGKIPTNGLSFNHVLKDIETLNQWALQGRLEITAISVHAYAFAADRYAVLASGASVGDGYGPMIVAREKFSAEELKGKRIAVPGKLTTAFLALQLFLEDFVPVFMPFDQIMDAVKQRKVEAGLLIHEGQLTHSDHGLTQIVDLGAWWKDETGLPLPLGINVVRKDLGESMMTEVSKLLYQSIEWAWGSRSEALDYAMQFGRGLERRLADRFVGMYVNEFTRELGERGESGLQELLRRAAERQLIPQIPKVEFV